MGGCDHVARRAVLALRIPDSIAVIVADFVYNAAMRDQMFPRKPIEKELPKTPQKPGDEDQPSPSGL